MCEAEIIADALESLTERQEHHLTRRSYSLKETLRRLEKLKEQKDKEDTK
jgi:hypothetical protein